MYVQVAVAQVAAWPDQPSKEHSTQIETDRREYASFLRRAGWSPLPSQQLRQLMRLNSVDGVENLSSEVTSDWLKLPFYTNAFLIRLQIRGSTNAAYFLTDQKHYERLDGSSQALHRFNSRNKLLLTQETAAQYLWFFGFFVRANNKPFLMVEDISDASLPENLSTTDTNFLTREASPPRCHGELGASIFSCEATVLFGDVLFAATFKVQSNGQVDMVEDRQRGKLSSDDIRAAIRLRESTTSNLASGIWIYREEEDPITGKIKQFIFGFPDGFPATTTSPYIRIGCYGRNDAYPMGLTLHWGQDMADMFPDGDMNMLRVTARFGQATPQDFGFQFFKDWKHTSPPDVLSGGVAGIGGAFLKEILPGAPMSKTNFTWKAQDFHFGLLTNDRLAIRARSVSGQDVTYLFPTNGYREAASGFKDHCNKR